MRVGWLLILSLVLLGCASSAAHERAVSPAKASHPTAVLPYYAPSSDRPRWSTLALDPAVCHSNAPCTDYWNAPGSKIHVGSNIANSWPTSHCGERTDSGFLATSGDGSIATVRPDRWQAEAGPEGDDLGTWRLTLSGVAGIALPEEPFDVAAFGGQAFVGFNSGSIGRYPDRKGLQLRPVAAARRDDVAVFGIGQEFYTFAAGDKDARIRALDPNSLPQAGYESGGLVRVWINRKWVLRAFSTVAGSFWEAVQRSDAGPRSSVVAYGGLGSCGHPLYGDEALVLDSRGKSVDVVAVNMLDRTVTWRANDVPLDESYCVAAEDGVLAIGGVRDGVGAVAIRASEKWHVVKLASVGSVIDPIVRDGVVIAAAPGEDYVSVDTSKERVRRAGAVYVIERRGQDWFAALRVVSARPKKLGLFGFRTVVSHGQLLINEFGGQRAPDAQDGVPDGPAEVCKSSLEPDGVSDGNRGR
jgi:hypothetical protein